MSCPPRAGRSKAATAPRTPPKAGGSRLPSAGWLGWPARNRPMVKHGLTRSPYIQMRRAAYSAPFVILVHAHLSLEWGATAAERLSYVFDCDAMTMTPMTAPSAGGTSTRSKRTSSSVTKTRPSVWSSRAGSARRTFRARRGWARGMILAGLVRPGGQLTYLRDQGVSADQLREVADGARTNAQS